MFSVTVGPEGQIFNLPVTIRLTWEDADNDGTVEELRETFIQIAAYAGAPAGVESFRIARRVLKEEGAIE